MNEIAFNILDEPWILVTYLNGESGEISLKDALKNAHKIKSLSGELPAQDAAVTRLLLAVLYAVFTRVDVNGEELDDDYDAVGLWTSLWELKKFPEKQIDKYLIIYYDRFWLVHPERPFWQISKIDKGTKYDVPKLIGELSESSNKTRLFQSRNGKTKNEITYAEAVRWLISLNGFDDTSSKPTGQNMPTPGAGWLGKLGIVYAIGTNLFETLMYNFVLQDSNKKNWENGHAIWELDAPRNKERIEIPVPNSPIELLTLQSRRICLEKRNNMIVGYKILGGDFFQKEDAFIEQMTIWKFNDDKKTNYVPKRHNPSKQFWRSFTLLLLVTEDTCPPGFINWLANLKINSKVKIKNINMQAVSVVYGDKDSSVADSWSDSFSLNSSLLSAIGDKWVIRISDLLKSTDNMVKAYGQLAFDIEKSSGGFEKLFDKRDAAKDEAYFNLDMPFRNWLEKIDIEDEDMDDVCSKWENRARSIILKLGDELAAKSGNAAFTGRIINKKPLNTSIAHINFKNSIASILVYKNNENKKDGGDLSGR